MERGNGAELIIHEGKIAGIKFGVDACTEHECGINPIKAAFGLAPKITRETHGLDARTVTKVPEGLHFREFGATTYLIYCPESKFWKDKDFSRERLDRLIRVWDKDEISTAWNERSFGIMIREDKDGFLKRLVEAFKAGDAVFFSMPVPFMGSAPHICIKSTVPQKIVEQFVKNDTSYLDLVDAVEASGIKIRLHEAGKEYHSLSPRWKDDEHKEFHLWLNPWDQQRYNAGWFSVEDLDAWIRNEGPVMKADRHQAVS